MTRHRPAHLAVAGALAIALSTPAAFAQFEGCTTPVIFGRPDYPPISYRDGDTLAGWAPAIAVAVFDSFRLTATVRYTGTWRETLAAAARGEADIVIGLYEDDPAAADYYLMDTALGTDEIVVIVPAGRTFPFAVAPDLAGRTGIAGPDSFGMALDSTLAGLDVRREADLDAALQTVAGGGADYLVASRIAAAAAAERLGIADRIETLPGTLARKSLLVGMYFEARCNFPSSFRDVLADLPNALVTELRAEAEAEWAARSSAEP